MTERTFRIQTGHWHDNQGGHGMSVNISDDISGVTLVDLQLSPEQAYDFMRGSTITADGSHGNRLDWVGKRMVHESHEVPNGVYMDAKYAEWEAVGIEWARKTFPDWDTHEARRTNTGGVTAIIRKWVEA